MYVNVIIKARTEDEDYIDACARIRHISRTALLRRVLKTVIEDKMVGAILDDIKWEEI